MPHSTALLYAYTAIYAYSQSYDLSQLSIGTAQSAHRAASVAVAE